MLKDDFSKEYRSLGLSQLGLGLAVPLLKKQASTWRPLTNPLPLLEACAKWRKLLAVVSEPSTRSKDAATLSLNNPLVAGRAVEESSNDDAFAQLVHEVLFPHLRRTIMRGEWKVRDAESAIRLMEESTRILGEDVVSNLTRLLVFPRLSAEIAIWDPMQDTVPIHQWLHPWLPYLGEQLEPLYGV